jgi:hypothetical protein
MKEIDYLENLGLDGRIILNWTLKKVCVWIRLDRLRMRSSGGLLWTRWWAVGFYVRREVFWLPEWLLVSQELTLLLTPWCMILFETLIVTQLVKKYPTFFMETEGSLLFSQKPAIGPYPEQLLRSCQRISPGPIRFETFRNKINFYGKGLLAQKPRLQAGEPPLVGCPRLLIQYIRSYPPYLEVLRTRHAVVARDRP